jgi:O-antigen ligase
MLYFGMGLQGYSDKLSSVYIDASIPHNGFQELIVMWGIPGLLLFSAFLVGLVINARKKNKNIIFINYIPFIIMMIFVQAAQMVSSSVISMLFAVVYLCLVIDLKRNDKLADVKPSSKYGGNHGLFFKS